MSAVDVNALFSRAEQAYAEGRFDAARADLGQIRRSIGDQPAVLHLLALVEKRCGAPAKSKAAFEAALELAPRDPQIHNNYAALLESSGELDAALRHFDQAVAAEPRFAEARFNRALLLQRLGRADEALTEIDVVLTLSPASAKAHSARASLLRDSGRLAEAASAYDRALAIEPDRPTALHGRARTALERGEPDASERYRQALAHAAGDPTLILGLAEALEAEGKAECLEILAAAVAARPDWVEGQSALARMRWEAGEADDFTRDLEQAIAASPRNRDLWLAYVRALAAAELPAKAADAAGQGRSAVGDDPDLELQEAINASTAGDFERAERLYALLPETVPGRHLHEAEHRLRQGRYEAALKLAGQARQSDPWNIGAWATTGLAWRLLGDSGAEWLHGQDGLVRSLELGLSSGEIAATADRLGSLHRTRAHPIGQSLRGGTQTRGRLFDRTEPEIKTLRDAIHAAVIDYWQSLPPFDAAHPLLRWRRHEPRFAGSWSVRLTDGGFHVAHIHPRGILSSACYLAVPDDRSDRGGWLEIGRPPEHLRLPLEPIATVEPMPGRLALFPSTLYHGTRRFAAGERLTAAFDIVAG